MRFAPGASVIGSVTLNVVVFAAFFHALGRPGSLEWIHPVSTARSTAIAPIRYVVLPEPAAVVESPLPGARATAVRPTSLRTMKRSGLAELPPGGTDNVRAPSIDASAITSAGGLDNADGVNLTPARGDPRLWDTPGTYRAPVPTSATELEGTLARAVGASNDSILKLGIQTVHPDWVVTRNGDKFGLDNKRIHLGKLSVPAAVLGLLPIPYYGCMPTLYLPERSVRDSAGTICITLPNPGLAERGERIGEMSAEIRARSELALQARREIDRIAARKARERAAPLRARPQSPPAASPPH